MMRRLLLIACLVSVAVAPAAAYLKIGFRAGNRLVGVRWDQRPVPYFITNRDGGGLTVPQIRGAIERAFTTWANEPDLDLSFDFRGFTGAEPFDEDGMNTLGFVDEPELERVLGATGFTVDTVTGRLLESDIFFNSAFDWSVAPGGDPAAYDLESTAVHEIGHFIGLGHSAIGETQLLGDRRRVIAKQSVMFPIAFPQGSISDRVLKADDVAGAADIYPARDYERRHGSATGRVLLDGRGIFGAHVTAFSLETGRIVGGFTLDTDGRFVIAGLVPGLHVIRVEPLDDGDIGSYFDDQANVEIGFEATIAPSLVSVPAGGASSDVTINVRRR